MSKFIHFQDVKVDNKDTWKNKFILTFDLDWADDNVIGFTNDILKKIDKKATIFVTHNTKYLDIFKNNNKIEFGIHPNFNLCFDSRKYSVESVLKKNIEIVPKAVISRSHSLTTSGRWLDIYKLNGIKYLSNYMMEWQQNISPFYHINNLIEVPIFFADDGLIYNEKIDNNLIENVIRKSIKISDSLKVFNFHPIHLYLNTPSQNYYIDNKNVKKINKSNIGVYNLFLNLIEEIDNV